MHNEYGDSISNNKNNNYKINMPKNSSMTNIRPHNFTSVNQISSKPTIPSNQVYSGNIYTSSTIQNIKPIVMSSQVLQKPSPQIFTQYSSEMTMRPASQKDVFKQFNFASSENDSKQLQDNSNQRTLPTNLQNKQAFQTVGSPIMIPQNRMVNYSPQPVIGRNTLGSSLVENNQGRLVTTTLPYRSSLERTIANPRFVEYIGSEKNGNMVKQDSQTNYKPSSIIMDSSKPSVTNQPRGSIETGLDRYKVDINRFQVYQPDQNKVELYKEIPTKTLMEHNKLNSSNSYNPTVTDSAKHNNNGPYRSMQPFELHNPKTNGPMMNSFEVNSVILSSSKPTDSIIRSTAVLKKPDQLQMSFSTFSNQPQKKVIESTPNVMSQVQMQNPLSLPKPKEAIKSEKPPIVVQKMPRRSISPPKNSTMESEATKAHMNSKRSQSILKKKNTLESGTKQKPDRKKSVTFDIERNTEITFKKYLNKMYKSMKKMPKEDEESSEGNGTISKIFSKANFGGESPQPLFQIK